MTDRPILFSAPMVRALLAGTKTQTRQVLKAPKPFAEGDDMDAQIAADAIRPKWSMGDLLWVRETWADVNTESGPALLFRADQHYHFCLDDMWPVEYRRYPGCKFSMWCGDLLRGEPRHGWRPSMPRWASRLTLTVTDVRVQRLQDISEEDAVAEGVYYQAPTAQDNAENRALHIEEYGTEPTDETRGVWIAPGTRNGFSKKSEDEKWGPTAVVAYRWLWEHINGPSSWEANPWIVALTFDVRKGNIDG